MKKRQLLVFAMALSTACAVSFTALPVQAASLTQAASTEDVTYGVVTDAERELLKGLFDAEFYAEQNPDLKDLYGTDYDMLFEHFCQLGVFEGRSCNANFDASAYASAYSDLKDVFGSDILKYYEHYVTIGISESRTLTTMQACADAGITVHPLTNESVSITPLVFWIASNYGITDINSLSTLAVGVSSASNGGGSVVLAPKDDNKVLAEVKDLEKIGTVTAQSGSYCLYVTYSIRVGKQGLAVYQVDNDTNESTLVTKTDDYEAFDTTGVQENYQAASVQVIIFSKDQSATANVNDPHYELITESSNYDIDGVCVNFGGGSQSSAATSTDNTKLYESSFEPDYESIRATTYVSGMEKIDGYYTDPANGEWHKFETPDEETAYMAANPNAAYYNQTGYAVDANGSEGDVYDIGLNITENEDGKYQITIGVSNEENGFAVIQDYDLTVERPTSDSNSESTTDASTSSTTDSSDNN